MKHLAAHYSQWGIHTIALPPLGCGLGGLKWENVKTLIEKHLAEIPDLEVFVYEPTVAGINANVPSADAETQPEVERKIAAQPDL